MKGGAESVGPAGDSKENAQWWLLFAIMVANKSAEQTTKKLNKFLMTGVNMNKSAFEMVTAYDQERVLDSALRTAKTGQYTRIAAAFRDVTVKLPPAVGDDPRSWSLATLETVSGIGPKTARWFYLLINPGARVAALDTHVLKFLRDNGADAPKITPPAGRKYYILERAFVEYAERLDVMPRDLDFFVWTVYRNGGHITLPEV